MNITKNSLTDYIQEEYHAKMMEPQIDAHIAEYESMLKPVTVRLHPDALKTIDNIAKYFGKSRQEIMTNVIEGGIELVFSTLAQAYCASNPSFRDIHDEQYAEELEIARTNFIKEITA